MFCKQEEIPGSLFVQAPSEGQFEIYRVTSESPFQLTSEQVGYYNKDVFLQAGSYLVLADCSYKQVIIHPGTHRFLVAHDVAFTPSEKPSHQDKFSIQCNRFQLTRSRQQLNNRYHLKLLSGEWELLVGMVTKKVSFDTKSHDSQVLRFPLASLRVGKSTSTKDDYFVSPKNEFLSLTASQGFGKRLFLLPGPYIIEVNGTSMQVSLQSGDNRTIQPAYFSVETPKKVNLAKSQIVRGTPHFVYLNGETLMNFNQEYPVLPGLNEVSLDGSSKKHVVNFIEDEHFVLKAKSVQVERGCTRWEWGCLGGQKIRLYLDERPYPFNESASDVPIFFVAEDVWLGLEGSQDIRFRLSKKSSNLKLRLGHLRFIPKPVLSHVYYTDLVRVETMSERFAGNSLDIPLDRATSMPLIEGRYFLTQYSSLQASEGERKKVQRIVQVRPGKYREVSYPVYLSETKYAQWMKNRLKRRMRHAKNYHQGARIQAL